MNIPTLSRHLERFALLALKAIEKNPKLTPQKALSKVAKVRFEKSQRDKILNFIKLNRVPPPPSRFNVKAHKADATAHDNHQRKLLQGDF